MRLCWCLNIYNRAWLRVCLFCFFETSEAFVFTPCVHASAGGLQAFTRLTMTFCYIRGKHDLHLDQSLSATPTPVSNRHTPEVQYSLIYSCLVFSAFTHGTKRGEQTTSLIQQYLTFLGSPPSPTQKKAFVGHEWLQADPLPIHPEAMLKWPTTWIEMKVSRIEVTESFKASLLLQRVLVVWCTSSFTSSKLISLRRGISVYTNRQQTWRSHLDSPWYWNLVNPQKVQ